MHWSQSLSYLPLFGITTGHNDETDQSSSLLYRDRNVHCVSWKKSALVFYMRHLNLTYCVCLRWCGFRNSESWCKNHQWINCFALVRSVKWCWRHCMSEKTDGERERKTKRTVDNVTERWWAVKSGCKRCETNVNSYIDFRYALMGSSWYNLETLKATVFIASQNLTFYFQKKM